MHMRFRAARVTAATIAAATAGLALPATAHAAVTCADGVWKATYHPNTSFSGTPRLTTCDTSINEDYGTGDPAGNGTTAQRQLRRPLADHPRLRLRGTLRLHRRRPRRHPRLCRRHPQGRHVEERLHDPGQNRQPHHSERPSQHPRRLRRVDGLRQRQVRLCARTSATVDTIGPLAPTGVSTAYDPTTLKVSTRWAKRPEMDLAGTASTGASPVPRPGPGSPHPPRRPSPTARLPPVPDTSTSYAPWTRPATNPAARPSRPSPPPTGPRPPYPRGSPPRTARRASPWPGGRSRAPPATTSPGEPDHGRRLGPRLQQGRHGHRGLLDGHHRPGTVAPPYRVSAVDAAGNVSARSAVDSVTRDDHRRSRRPVSRPRPCPAPASC